MEIEIESDENDADSLPTEASDNQPIRSEFRIHVNGNSKEIQGR